ncbi:MAG TPA: S24/S26 family peptidase [Nitrospirota bacterium]|nr:S24/S26 family peptidase [Nitrospirota bacterium]
MEPKIKDGQLYLFRKDPGGSRNGKIILCQVRGFAGEAPVALIKQYRSARTSSNENIGEAKAIVLSSLNEKHEDIVLTGGEHLSVIGIFERVIEE